MYKLQKKVELWKKYIQKRFNTVINLDDLLLKQPIESSQFQEQEDEEEDGEILNDSELAEPELVP